MIKIIDIILAVSILLSAISGTLSYSSGSKVCSVDQKTLEGVSNQPMGKSVNTLGYSFSKNLKYKASGDSLNIKIQGSEEFNGLLIWALDSDGKNQGTFELPSGDYKFVTGCDSVVTHSNPGTKGKSVTIKWTPPKKDVGDITINAAIVVTFKGFEIIKTTVKSSSSKSTSKAKSTTSKSPSSAAPTLTANISPSITSSPSVTKSDNSQLSASPLLLLLLLILTTLISINF
ncbi:6814_t:CDS:2 [Diversispora eburnea]|uniref:6814_t:CDS:1 n=1 Tax=Diversispora eburnea TaxID=1213867 RepID=A0A9N8VKC8_9GLOM|nr:6814_t:CDS:2 [Diversispora eburnea]